LRGKFEREDEVIVGERWRGEVDKWGWGGMNKCLPMMTRIRGLWGGVRPMGNK
jgi:hypothetical protein